MLANSILLLSFTFLLSASAKKADAQGILKQPASAVQEAVSSLSSLFAGKIKASNSTQAPYCCGGDCPPAACDVNRVIPTDLGYAFPAPTAPAQKQAPTPVKLPCCGLGCVDGGCREAALHQGRPTITQPPRRKATDTLNVIIGCCSTCQDCDEFVITRHPTREPCEAEATPTPEPKAGIYDNDNDNDKEEVDAARVLQVHANNRICIGCYPCTPCDQADIKTWVTFFARPSRDGQREETTATTTAPRTRVPTNTAEPTYILGDDVDASLNGENQDTLPLVVHSGSGELITLLATVDLKLEENYISRRYLAHLTLSDKTVPYPKGLDARIAILSAYLNQTAINATIMLDVVAGTDAARPATRRLYKNVRFNVYGSERDEGLEIPDVIVGSRLLSQVGGLTVFSGFRGKVEDGVKVLYPAHLGELEGDENGVDDNDGAGGEGHDEL